MNNLLTYPAYPGLDISLASVLNGDRIHMKTTTNLGCTAITGDLIVPVIPFPPKPFVTANGNVLSSSYVGKSQWYYNGKLLTGSGKSIISIGSGIYKVESVIGACKVLSDPYYHNNVELKAEEINEFEMFPNPVGENLVFKRLPGKVQITIFDIIGKPVKSAFADTESSISLIELHAGIFLVQVSCSDGSRYLRKIQVIR
jgi:hypothetical protein